MKRAFSLIELLIVVVIMGLVYSLAVSNFQRVGDEAAKVTLGTLKEYLQTLPREKNAKLLCLDNCSSCDVYVDGVKSEELDGKFDDLLDESVEVYTYDFSYGTQLKRKEVYFNQENVDEEVCFSYEVDKKGVGDQVFVAFKKVIYDFSPYFTSTLKYDSLEEAVEARESLVRELK